MTFFILMFCWIISGMLLVTKTTSRSTNHARSRSITYPFLYGETNKINSPELFYPLCVCPYIYMYVAIWGLFSPSIRILDHTPYIIRFASMEWGFYILHKTTSRVFSLFSASSFLRAISAFMMHGKSHDFPSLWMYGYGLDNSTTTDQLIIIWVRLTV